MSAQPHRILLVDDEPHMVRLAELSLRKGGYTLMVGRNGREAVDLATREKPDLVIMDVIMPELDGIAALHQLKANPITACIPVIMLTARGHIMTRQEAEASGASAFLTKPFSPTQLFMEAKRLLG